MVVDWWVVEKLVVEKRSRPFRPEYYFRSHFKERFRCLLFYVQGLWYSLSTYLSLAIKLPDSSSEG